jgi:hypothetical protein
VRLPTLEIFAALHGDLFAEAGRSLTRRERDLASPIFGRALAYDAVRVAVASFANAPTTLGNFIRISPEIARRGIPDETLIHELTHIWQFQTRGMRYMSNSLCSQVKGMIMEGTRNAAYELSLEDVEQARSIDRLPAEKQAVFVEKWFMDQPLVSNAQPQPGVPNPSPRVVPIRKHPIAESMMREVQSAEPLALTEILDEAAFGPGHRHPSIGPAAEPSTPLIPFLRIEF